MSLNNSSASQGVYLDKRRVTVVGAVVNLVLSAAKIAFGLIGQSQALVADGLHSLSDLASDAMVLVAAKFGSQDADAEHPYGHARFETIATIGLGLLLISVATGIALDAIDRILNPASLLVPGYTALVVTTVSILSKEWLYRYTVHVANRLRSEMLRANAWHHRSDAVSSIIVFIGIAGTMAGVPWLDAVGAIGVALMIGKIGWDVGWASVRELVDTGVDTETRREMQDIIASIAGVRGHHMLRTRRMGPDVLVEAHVLVAPDLTVSEGHRISDEVRGRLMGMSADIADVLVHIDPEDDATERPSSGLPSREDLLAQLRERWSSLSAAAAIENTHFHYVAGRVDVDIVLPLDAADDVAGAKTLAAQIRDLTQAHPDVGRTTVFFR